MNEAQTPEAVIEVDSLVRPIDGEPGHLMRVLEPKRGGWLVVETLGQSGTGNVRRNTVELAFEEQDDEEQDDEEQDDEDADEPTGGSMAQTLARYRARYPKATKPNGKSTQDLNDRIAQMLRPLEPTDVCLIADRVFELEAGSHVAKYAGLNNGQKRMNSGNRIRAAFKKADEAGQARILAIVGKMAAAIAESETETA